VTGFDIGSKHVGDGAPCLIVAEVAQAHEGSLQIAHAYIDAIADARADAVKFQCHIAEAESTPDEPWRVEPRWRQDANRYDYWKRMEFSEAEWRSLADHCDQRGVLFLCSPFSVEAVKLLDPLVPAWKVASGEVTNDRLMSAIEDTEKPVLMSLGMTTRAEYRSGWSKDFECSGLALLQCTSEYPCKPEHVGLNMLAEMRGWCHYGSSHPLPTGLSDHSGTIYAGLAAVALGCDVLEVHVKLSKHDQGFDASSSITVEELKQLVEGVRFIEKAKTPVDKDALAKELEPMRRLFMGRAERKAKADAQYCRPCDLPLSRCAHGVMA
jgi:N-acetylneuraminate synthase